MSKKRRAYVEYLRSTIIPDTKASGMTATGKDLEKCARLVAGQKTDAQFARFLRQTLIPDFRSSGRTGYVEDFQTCARYITPRRRRR